MNSRELVPFLALVLAACSPPVTASDAAADGSDSRVGTDAPMDAPLDANDANDANDASDAIDTTDAPSADSSDTIAVDAVDAPTCEAGSFCGTSCVDTQTDPVNCGSCGHACATPHAMTSCASGACMIQCDAGFHRCGEMCAPDNSVIACGSSCTVCPAPAHSTPSCAVGLCSFECDPGYTGMGSVCVPTLDPPRPIAPISTSTVTSRRPLFRWELSSGADGAQIDICRDRACGDMVTRIDATGTSATPSSDLPVGVLFWRLHGAAGGVADPSSGVTWQFTVGARSASVATAWGTTPDFNGDGLADVAIGALGSMAYRGRVFVHDGATSGVSATPTTTLLGPDPNARFGLAVASAGDIDGDGYGDLVVGAPFASTYGRVYVFRGSATGVALAPSQYVQGFTGGYSFGSSIAGAGDVNGDGYGDVVVGEQSASNNRVHIFLGSAIGLASAPATTLMPFSGVMSGSPGPVVSCAGDVNGDGFGDVMVGDGGYMRVQIFNGSSSGISTTASTTITGTGSLYAWNSSGAGDVNGDGYTDVMIGVLGSDRVDVHYGSASGVHTTADAMMTGPASDEFGETLSLAGDVDGDGFGDVLVGAPAAPGGGAVYVYRGSAIGLDVSSALVLHPPPVGASSFALGVACAGDTNGDTFGDIVVGDYQQAGHGAAYLFPGSAGGVTMTPMPTFSISESASQFGRTLVWFAPHTAARDRAI